jgi:hypothetical protein
MKIFEHREWITSDEAAGLLDTSRQELQLILDEGLLPIYFDTRKNFDWVYSSSSTYFSIGYELKGKDILAVSHFIRKQENEKYLQLDIEQSFPNGIVNYEEHYSLFSPILMTENNSQSVVLVELTNGYLISGLAEQPFSLNAFVFKKSDVLSLKNKKAKSSSTASEIFNNHEKNKHISPLMSIAHEIWDEHYSTLPEGAQQPTKDYLIAWIRKRHPKLSSNQAESLYNVTRRDPPNL